MSDLFVTYNILNSEGVLASSVIVNNTCIKSSVYEGRTIYTLTRVRSVDKTKCYDYCSAYANYMVYKREYGRHMDQTLTDGSGRQKRSLLRCDGGNDTSVPASEPQDSPCQITVQNLGGISSAELSIPSGVSILVGRNATNRSSLLRSLAAGLGGEKAAARLKSDTDNGSVRLNIGERSHTREYTRSGQLVQKRGEPYTSDSAIVDTFVALFADCPARRAVERDVGLRNALMKPVDTNEIKSQISELKQRRSELNETIERAKSRKKKLPDLEKKRASLNDDLDSIEAKIESLQSTVEKIELTDDESDETTELRSQLEELRSELNSVERRANEVEQQLEFRREERSELIDEREELTAELDGYDEPSTIRTEISELDSNITRLSEQQQTLEKAIEDLQSVIQANEMFLQDGIETVGLSSEDSVTAELDPDSQTVECWTCGTSVEQATISDQMETLRGIAKQQRTEMSKIEEDISELKQEKVTYENKLSEYEKRTRRMEELEARIEQHGDKIQELKTEYEKTQNEIDRLRNDITSVEREVKETETGGNEEKDEFVDTHKKLTSAERERGRLENQLDATLEKIEEIEELDSKREDAEKQRAEISDELNDLRGRIDRLETELIETLNSIMDDLIDRLKYKNIARVWIERQTFEDGSDSTFELHIVREADDGSVYEDTVDTLSESEQEVIGLVVSLAGYLVHDVDQMVPFLLLDSVEMIDGKRLAELLDYIDTETDLEFLSVALLPKDARSVEEAGVLDEFTTIDFESALT